MLCRSSTPDCLSLPSAVETRWRHPTVSSCMRRALATNSLRQQMLPARLLEHSQAMPDAWLPTATRSQPRHSRPRPVIPRRLRMPLPICRGIFGPTHGCGHKSIVKLNERGCASHRRPWCRRASAATTMASAHHTRHARGCATPLSIGCGHLFNDVQRFRAALRCHTSRCLPARGMHSRCTRCHHGVALRTTERRKEVNYTLRS